jgi:glycosyltransferase involved in cell wall biosynthesis
MVSPFVSIIIPTYCDWSRLSLCLDSLQNQSYSASDFEIIAVNNNPADLPPADFKLPANCTILTESKPGSYAARNAALRIAKGQIMGFTDSDCIADIDWITNAVTLFENNADVDRIGGRINIFFAKKRPSKVELHDRIFAFRQEGYVKNGYAVTGNMFSRRKVFDNIGFFNDTVMSGGDYLWGALANKNGHKIIFGDNVIINHPARPTLQELIKKEKRVAKGQSTFINKPDKGSLQVIKEFVQICKPRTWEIKRIFQEGRDLSLIDKLAVVTIRHYIIFVGSMSQIIKSK